LRAFDPGCYLILQRLNLPKVGPSCSGKAFERVAIRPGGGCFGFAPHYLRARSAPAFRIMAAISHRPERPHA
jgi:hypothetical protein